MENKKNPKNFMELHAYYKRTIARFKKFNLSEEEAEDLAQEVFIRVHNRMPASLYGTEKLIPYFWKIVNNLGVDATRKRKNNPIVNYFSFDEAFSGSCSPHYRPESEYYDEICLPGEKTSPEKLYSLIGELGEKERKLLSLRFFEKRSYEEIAAVMGRTSSWVGNELNRAIARLRKIIKSKNFKYSDFS